MGAEHHFEDLNLRGIFKSAQGTNFLLQNIVWLSYMEQNSFFAVYCCETQGSIHLTQAAHVY